VRALPRSLEVVRAGDLVRVDGDLGLVTVRSHIVADRDSADRSSQ
jgi:hypothetical protein